MRAKESHVKADIDYLRLGANIFELSQRGAELYEKQMSLNEKREALNLVFSSIKLYGEKLDLAFHNGFEVIAARAKSKDWLGVVDDFRTFGWVERITSPSRVLNKTQLLLIG